jgi:hypothetical protein
MPLNDVRGMLLPLGTSTSLSAGHAWLLGAEPVGLQLTDDASAGGSQLTTNLSAARMQPTVDVSTSGPPLTVGVSAVRSQLRVDAVAASSLLTIEVSSATWLVYELLRCERSLKD